MQETVYREWVSAGILVKVLMGGFSLIIICITALLAIFGNLDVEDFYGLIIGWGVLAFVLFLFWNYRGLEIKISSKKLTVDYGIFNKKSIELSNIASCKVTQASFGRYGGVGVRYGFDGSTAYTTSFGNAVEITPRNGQTFVFSSVNTKRICTIIKTKIEAIGRSD